MSGIFFPVSFVNCSLVVYLSFFLHFIIINLESFSVHCLVMKISFCICSIIWFFEANKGIWVSSSFSKSDFFDFSIMSENIGNILLSPVVWEIFNVEIASFFRLFISNGFSLFVNCPLLFAESMLNNEFQLASFDVSSIKSINSLISAFRSVFFIHGIIIAYKCEFPDIVWLNNTRLDVSKRLEHFFYLSIAPIVGDVFDVNVVDKLSLGFLDIFRFEFTNYSVLWLILKSIFSRLNVLEAYESISSWSIIFINWCFHTLDFSILFKNFMQLRASKITFLWKLDENILVYKFFSVGSKNLVVKWKSTALFAIDFKVSHLFGCNFKLSSIFNAYDSSVEWLRENISIDLWLNVKGDPCVLLKCFFNFYWSAFVFR